MEVHCTVNKSISEVYAILKDLKNYGKYHPIITDVKQIEANKYKIYETVRMGLIPIRFVYPATVSTNEATDQIVYDAVVMNLVKIKMDYTLSPINAQTTNVMEKITIKSILPVHWYLSRLIKKCHIELFDRVSKS